MATISQITAGNAKPVSKQAIIDLSCSQSPVLELGDNAKEFGG